MEQERTESAIPQEYRDNLQAHGMAIDTLEELEPQAYRIVARPMRQLGISTGVAVGRLKQCVESPDYWYVMEVGDERLVTIHQDGVVLI